MSATFTERRIRVFISSTFTDMKADRDYLVKFIFPQLRKLCEERAVTWTEVDLRWGVTDEQKAEGKVLRIVLEEVEHCHPYFIGLLGERYGEIYRDEIPFDLIERFPWLKDHEKSLTELEILHGVLNDKELSDHALFYFRDPAYAKAKRDGGQSGFISDDEASRKKLEDLKQRIRGAHKNGKLKYAPREKPPYTNPHALGEQLLADFTEIIEGLYPKEKTPDWLDQEAARHEAYARSRRLAFVGRDNLLRGLNEHVSAVGKPLVLTGESGCGKSALLAEWVNRWREKNRDDLIIQHYIGSTPDSADWEGLVRRILGELKRTFLIADEIPSNADALRKALQDWTSKSADPRRRVILVLDALNQLAGDGAAQQLGWLPAVFPANFRVIVSTLPGESLEVVKHREWKLETVGLFDDVKVRTKLLWRFLRYHRKKLNKPRRRRIAAADQTANPLFLCALLDEMRQFGEHERLDERIDYYLSASDLPGLFDRILSRWHDDFGKDPVHPDIVRRALCLIACARFGLLESELLDLLGKNDERLPGRYWTPFYLAAENALALRAGLLNFGHDYLRAAVQRRWLADPAILRVFRFCIADYFEKQSETTRRKVAELPWQLAKAEAKTQLTACLTGRGMFMALDRYELLAYRLHLGAFDKVGLLFLAAWTKWEHEFSSNEELPDCARKLALFLGEIGLVELTELLLLKALTFDEEHFGENHPNVAKDLGYLFSLMRSTNRLNKAEPILRRALAIDEGQPEVDENKLAASLSNLALFLKDTGRLDEAETSYRRVLSIQENFRGKEHPDTALTLNNLGRVLEVKKQLAEAEALYRRALAIFQNNLGSEHPYLAATLNNLALLLMSLEKFTEAEPLLRRALEIERSSFGPQHPNVARTLNHLAQVQIKMGRLFDAEPLLKQALEIDEWSFDSAHPRVHSNLLHLAGLLHATGRLVEAESLMLRAIKIMVETSRSSGTLHPKWKTTLQLYAFLLAQMGHSQEQILAKIKECGRC